MEPCTVSDANRAPETAANRQIQKAHLHDNVGDVVHVEQADAKWQDLFTNIKYDLDYSHTEAYLNGQKMANFSSLPIKDDDSLVVFVGNGNNISEFLIQAVTVEHIRQEAAKSEDCK